MKKGRDLLDHSAFLNKHPNLQSLFEGPRAEFGSLVISKRQEKGWSQQDLALHSGIDIENVWRIEGRTPVMKEVVFKVSELLQMEDNIIIHNYLNEL